MKNFLRDLILLVLLVVVACNKQDNDKISTKTKPVLNYESAYNIPQTKYLNKPDTVLFGELGSRKYIASVFTTDIFFKKITVLSNYANKWQAQDTVNDLFGIVDVQFVRIDSVDYLFIADESSGNTMGSITFTLRDLELKKDYSISFNGYVGEYDQMDPIPANVKNNNGILNFLEEKAACSPYVYKQNPSDYNLDIPSNYDINWKVNNSGLRDKLSASKNTLFEIKFPEYEQNLFTAIKHGSEIMKIENPSYIIISYFKDNVIGYDKINKKYFGIWVPELIYHWISVLEFKSEYLLLMTEREDVRYSIDLKNKKIKML